MNKNKIKLGFIGCGKMAGSIIRGILASESTDKFEIIGSEVFDADTNELLGILSDVSETGANDVWHIKRGDREYLVPAIESVIVSVNIDEEKIVIKTLRGIFDDED